MTDTPTTGEPAETLPEVAERQAHDETVLDRLVKAVGELKDAITGKPQAGETAPVQASPEPGEGIGAEVRREVEKLSAAERRRESREAHDQAHADLAAKLERVVERVPREYRRSTRWMGWVTEDDQ